jgi:hypothetical protein
VGLTLFGLLDGKEGMSSTPASVALPSLIGAVALLLTAPSAAVGVGDDAGRSEAGPACEGIAGDREKGVDILGLTIRDRACVDGDRLMSEYHACLRTGIGEASCRLPGFQEHRDTAHIEDAFGSASAAPISVGTEAELRAAWADPLQTSIELSNDIFLRSCRSGEPIRESSRPITVDGNGHTIRQTCFEKRLLRQDGTGFVVLENITLTRGGNDGPGAAITTRGEILVLDSKVVQNLAEEPGGGIFSQRRATIIRSIITGNLANDDGGGVYARRGGVEVFDSILSNNLVDGSGGAIGSTGDILVVRSHVDGNTTDGDGGALYTDEDGDVTVIESTVDGNTADGPGGGIFTLEGDVTIVSSSVNGNRADDRGGAISGEADVILINSTIARNAAIAHVGGGIWARSDVFVTNSTVSNNYAEGQGGGVLAAGTVGLVNSTILDNTAPVAANVGGARLQAFGSIIGPAKIDLPGAQVPPTRTNCRVSASESFGHNLVSDASCRLGDPTDVVTSGDPLLAPLEENGGPTETRLPAPESRAVDLIPAAACGFIPFGEALEGEQHLEQFGIDVLAPISADQRGFGRPQGAGCDAGAVELSDGPEPPATEPGPSGSESAPFAVPDLVRPSPASAPVARRAPARRSPRSTVERLETRVDGIERMVRIMERIARRYKHWRTCLSQLPVSEYGDADHRFGYRYDEKDGTGLDLRPALAVDRQSRSDYAFLRFSRRDDCQSAPTRPGTPENPGTADPARVAGPPAVATSARRPHPLRSRVRVLERRLRSLGRRAERLERMAEHFDEWESCLSWVPVTEYGDPDGRYGYRFEPRGEGPDFMPALAVDISEWDDPDYMLLAFAGRDRPYAKRECQDEPGESVD